MKEIHMYVETAFQTEKNIDYWFKYSGIPSNCSGNNRANDLATVASLSFPILSTILVVGTTCSILLPGIVVHHKLHHRNLLG